ncbi:MAG: hypothetical protein GX085_03555 [Firmicutes bacterium]|nr:hypothetical protein [Bacillota bacterium]
MPSDYAEACARLKEDIVEVGRRIYNRGFVAANDGNISVRLGNDEILTTPTAMIQIFLGMSVIWPSNHWLHFIIKRFYLERQRIPFHILILISFIIFTANYML